MRSFWGKLMVSVLAIWRQLTQRTTNFQFADDPRETNYSGSIPAFMGEFATAGLSEKYRGFCMRVRVFCPSLLVLLVLRCIFGPSVLRPGYGSRKCYWTFAQGQWKSNATVVIASVGLAGLPSGTALIWRFGGVVDALQLPGMSIRPTLVSTKIRRRGKFDSV